MKNEIAIQEIVVENRQRIEIHNLDGIKESLQENGTIHPLVLTELPNGRLRLLAGGRRLHFLQELGHTTLYHASTCNAKRPGFVLGKELPEDQLLVLELEENLRRTDMGWQERCLGIATIHVKKQALAAIDGDSWSQKATGQMLGLSDCNINYNLMIARLLRSELSSDNKPLPTARFWACTSFSDAWRLRLRDMEDAAIALNSTIVRQQFSQGSPNGLPITTVDSEFDLMPTEDITLSISPGDTLPSSDYEAARQRYESNPLNTQPFDAYYAERQRLSASLDAHRNTIHLSNRLIHGDSIAYMHAKENAGRFDHIITDIPYAIDVSYLNQQHPRGGMVDVDTIEDLHDEEYNIKLITDFFPAAFACTKEKAFVITWCDQMLWQFMYDCAVAAGFRVQRWPLTWHKTHSCLNQCAQYNFTKNTEIAIVCRKPGAMLRTTQPGCVITAGHDELTEQISHPFAKPEAVWQYTCDAVSIEGQTILEPFAGRGSGVISMLRMARHVIGVELDDTHYAHLVENVKQHYFLRVNPSFTFV